MATVAVPMEQKNYLNAEYGIRSWLFTTDHKRIALLYLISITAMFFIGGFFALMIRLELLTPAGDLLLPLGDTRGISRAGNRIEADVRLAIRVVVGEIENRLRAVESKSRALISARRIEVAL